MPGSAAARGRSAAFVPYARGFAAPVFALRPPGRSDIAVRLFLSQRTVDRHVAVVLRKLEVWTRQQAATGAHRLGVGAQDR